MSPARLHSLIRIRKSERDQRVQELAVASRHHSRLLADEHSLRHEHAQAVAAARQSEQTDLIDVRALAAHRAHVTQLLAAIEGMAVELEAAARRVEGERQRVVVADQKLQMLERLREKEQAEIDRQVARRAQFELEDAWGARNPPSTRSE